MEKEGRKALFEILEHLNQWIKCSNSCRGSETVVGNYDFFTNMPCCYSNNEEWGHWGYEIEKDIKEGDQVIFRLKSNVVKNIISQQICSNGCHQYDIKKEISWYLWNLQFLVFHNKWIYSDCFGNAVGIDEDKFSVDDVVNDNIKHVWDGFCFPRCKLYPYKLYWLIYFI